MAIILNLRPGLITDQNYKAFKFPGGELHFILSDSFKYILNESNDDIHVYAGVNSAEDLILLCIAVETIAKTYTNEIHVVFAYMPYQQADRDFSEGESFSLKTITNILNGLPVQSFTIYDPHSDVSPALLRNCQVITNHNYIKEVVDSIVHEDFQEELVILSPDAGAYKKIFKLAEAIKFDGGIETANKYRDIRSGDLKVRFSCDDFNGRDVLIVDDICIGGATFIALAEELLDKNVGKLYLAVSHGIFSRGFGELGNYFSKIYTTNSRHSEYGDLIDDWNINHAPRTNKYHTDEFELAVHSII